MEETRTNQISSLQFLRAFACLSVLFTHVLQTLKINPFGEYFISGGYGVDLFFILSGFLIYLTTKNNDCWSSFAIKRIFRIFPLYWFCVILFFTWEIINDNKEFTLLYYIQNFLMLPWTGILTTRSLVVGVAWSTVYEMYFYFTFVLLLLLKLQKKYIIILLIAFYIIFKTIKYFNLFYLNESEVFLFFYSVVGFSHIVPFILGILIAMIFQNDSLQKWIKTIRYSKFIFVVFHVFYFFILTQKYNAFTSYFISILIFFLWLNVDSILIINYKSFLSKIFIKLGDISFSIYLLHTLIINIIVNYFFVNNLVLVTLLTYTVSIGLSLITYKFIEEPCINLAKKIVNKRISNHKIQKK